MERLGEPGKELASGLGLRRRQRDGPGIERSGLAVWRTMDTSKFTSHAGDLGDRAHPLRAHRQVVKRDRTARDELTEPQSPPRGYFHSQGKWVPTTCGSSGLGLLPEGVQRCPGIPDRGSNSPP